MEYKKGETIDYYDLLAREGRIRVPKKFVLSLELMLWDLQENSLVVGLVPSMDFDRYVSDGDCIRNIESKNVEWYSKLCKMHPKPEYKTNRENGKKVKRRSRKNPESNLKKADIVSVINNMVNTQISKSKHAPYLLEIAEEYLELFGDDEIEMRKILGFSEERPWDEDNPFF